MSKRGGDSTRLRATKVKKRKGVGSRIITVLDSDEERSPSATGSGYARMTKTRVAASGKAERVAMSSVPVFEVEQASVQAPPEGDANDSADVVVENAIRSVPAKRRKKYNDSTKMHSWLSVRSTVLDDIVSLDGPGDRHLNLCNLCSNRQLAPLYRCLECSYSSLYCSECIVKLHGMVPLHRLECWKNGFFNRTTLHSLGLVCHLGHDGKPCPLESTPRDLTIIDANGWHKVRVTFCTCNAKIPWHERYRQLILMRWYPASFNRPRTAFSFDLLETYHKHTLQGKLNLYDFYLATMQKSDNQGRSKTMYRYHEISRCTRQWRHLKGVKRGGGVHQTHALCATKPGSFAIECPACPHPGRNLPDDWDAPSGANKWVYAQFIALDANFRLKLKNRQINDPELGSGWSYFVENSAYTRHVANNPHEKEVTSCGSEFHAVNQANSRGGKDYIASGVVKAVCARHCFVLPNAVGDLQRGERYINTDYIAAAYIKRCQVRDIKISYDIACKWSINLHTRFETSHEDVDLSRFSITHLVPKFHLPAHGSKCQVQYSFNYTHGVGRTHGETVEQEWAYINLAALSTREMGPGARHSALDDSWGGWNWKKVLGLGSLLETNLVKAVEMASIQRKAADDFTETFPHETVQQWRKMVKQWQADPSRPNPYVSNERASKLSEARLRLTQEEVTEAERGQHAPHRVSASVFVRMGLDLEDQQFGLLSTSTRKTRSDGQKATLFEKRGILLRQIEKWRQLQAVYMPGVLDAGTSDPESSPKVKAESIKLWLPSQLDAEDRGSICAGGVVKSEKELRFAQLEDALNDLRRARRIRRGLIIFHKIQLAGEGQKTQTKSRAVVQTIQDRIDRCSRRYRVARDALLSLDPHGDWQNLYLPLTEDDNRGPGKEPEEMSSSDGRYIPSWIWRSNTTAVSPDEVNEDMRVEWAQCMARADRWGEEVILLQEEMRRVVQFLEWRSNDWLAKADLRAGTITPAVHAGLLAYAKKQASVFHNLAVRFSQRWRSTLVSCSLSHTWATEFLETSKEPLDNPDFKKRKQNRDPPIARPRAESPPPITASTSPPVARPRAESPPPITASTSMSTISETIGHEAQVSDVDSDGSASEYDESEYESTGSFAE